MLPGLSPLKGLVSCLIWQRPKDLSEFPSSYYIDILSRLPPFATRVLWFWFFNSSLQPKMIAGSQIIVKSIKIFRYFSGFDSSSSKAFWISSTAIISEISASGFRFPLVSWSIASANSPWLTRDVTIFPSFQINSLKTIGAASSDNPQLKSVYSLYVPKVANPFVFLMAGKQILYRCVITSGL